MQRILAIASPSQEALTLHRGPHHPKRPLAATVYGHTKLTADVECLPPMSLSSGALTNHVPADTLCISEIRHNMHDKASNVAECCKPQVAHFRRRTAQRIGTNSAEQHLLRNLFCSLMLGQAT